MFATILSKLLLNKNTIMIVIVGAAIAYVTYTIYSLKTDLAECNNQIEKLKKDIVIKDIAMVNKENLINAMKSEKEELLATIDNVNKINTKKANELSVAKQELISWKAKPKEVKYKYIYKEVKNKKIDYDRATCKQGLELMKTISSLEYDKL